VEPLVRAIIIVAGNHVSVGYVFAEAVERLSYSVYISRDLLLMNLSTVVTQALEVLLSSLRGLPAKGSKKLLIFFI
jgi:hypothetical protein